MAQLNKIAEDVLKILQGDGEEDKDITSNEVKIELPYADYSKITRKEFERLPEDEKVLALTYLRSNFSLAEIEKNNNMSSYHVYKWVDKLGLEKEERVGFAKNPSKVRKGIGRNKSFDNEQLSLEDVNAPKVTSEEIETIEAELISDDNFGKHTSPDQNSKLMTFNNHIQSLDKVFDIDKAETTKQQENIETVYPVVMPAQDGLNYNLTGSYTAQELLKRLKKVCLLLEDETNNFDVNIFIQEKTIKRN